MHTERRSNENIEGILREVQDKWAYSRGCQKGMENGLQKVQLTDREVSKRI